MYEQDQAGQPVKFTFRLSQALTSQIKSPFLVELAAGILLTRLTDGAAGLRPARTGYECAATNCAH